MEKNVVENTDTIFVKFFLVKIIEFFFFYIRNIFLVGASMFIFIALMVIFIFYQDILHVDFLQSIFIFITSLSIVGDMIDMPNGTEYFDQDDLSVFFLRMSFYLTIFTEIIRYTKIYLLKKKDDRTWKNLKRRIIFVLSGVSLIYSFSALYVIMSTQKDAGWFLFIFIIFWMICCVMSVVFLFIDFFAQKVHKIIDEMNFVSINGSK